MEYRGFVRSVAEGRQAWVPAGQNRLRISVAKTEAIRRRCVFYICCRGLDLRGKSREAVEGVGARL